MGNSFSTNKSFSKEETYSKEEANSKFPERNNVYTKPEIDDKLQGFQPKGDYALLPNIYTREESDNKFQPKGDYALLPNIYTREESDNKFQPKGDYALLPNIYTRVESDNKFQPKDQNVFPKKAGFENPAVQLGETTDGRDDNIYSLSFGKAEKGTYTGMGLIPASRKEFKDTVHPILGTHIQKGSEWGLYSNGWDKLVNIEGTTGNMKIKGDFIAPNIPTRTDVENRINGLVNTNTLNDVKTQTLWCPAGEICNVPVGKPRIQFPNVGVMNSKGRMHVSSENEDIYLLPKKQVIIGKEWGGTGNLLAQGNITSMGGITISGGQLRTPPGANLCNSNGSICIDIADLKNLMDTAIRTDRRYEIIDPNDSNNYLQNRRSRFEVGLGAVADGNRNQGTWQFRLL